LIQGIYQYVGDAVEFMILGAGPDDEAELLSLHRWLKQDPELVGAVTIRLVEGEPSPELMGGALDALNVIINDAAAIAGLAVSFTTWQASRSSRRARTIRQDGQDRVLAAGATPEEVRAALEPGLAEAPLVSTGELHDGAEEPS
jgi:hypothetical protein